MIAFATSGRGLVVDDPLVRLLLMIMPAMPSSQTFVSIVQATLGSAATERMSALYLPQYAAAMLTVTAVLDCLELAVVESEFVGL